jgi:hypothetical protein
MGDDTKSKGRKPAQESQRIALSTPWGGPQQLLSRGSRCEFESPSDSNEFIRERTRLHETYVREEAKSRRVGLVLAFLGIVAAAAIVQFAPAGREKLSYWIGAALIIFAAGSCGFGRVWGKASRISFGADQDRGTQESRD